MESPIEGTHFKWGRKIRPCTFKPGSQAGYVPPSLPSQWLIHDYVLDSHTLVMSTLAISPGLGTPLDRGARRPVGKNDPKRYDHVE